jgi:uncharacterized protein YfcZ (UPF0381/DUF406 family)
MRNHEPSFEEIRPGNMPPGANSVGKRKSFERDMEQAGITVKAFLELAKRNPEAAVTIGTQIRNLIDSGATQAEVAEFFRNQFEASRAVADIASNSGDWQADLAKIRGGLSKTN